MLKKIRIINDGDAGRKLLWYVAWADGSSDNQADGLRDYILRLCPSAEMKRYFSAVLPTSRQVPKRRKELVLALLCYFLTSGIILRINGVSYGLSMIHLARNIDSKLNSDILSDVISLYGLDPTNLCFVIADGGGDVSNIASLLESKLCCQKASSSIGVWPIRCTL